MGRPVLHESAQRVFARCALAQRTGAARTAAGIAARRPTNRIGRAVACRIELVDDGIDIDAGAGTDGNHARQANHEVVAAACRALAEVCFQESPCLGIEESHAVQAAAARDELALLADDIVVDADDFTAFQAFTSRRYAFFFFMGRQDTGPLAAVAEQDGRKDMWSAAWNMSEGKLSA